MTKIASLLATILISTSAITPVLIPAAAHAAAGHRFVSEGISSPQELKGKILRNLQKDPTGNSKLEGGYATANDFLIAFKGEDKEAGLTDMTSLLKYLDTLVETTPEKGMEYANSMILDDGSVDIDGETRQFGDGEKAWMNPITKRIVLAARCANPVGAKRPPIIIQASCATVEWNSDAGDELFIGVMGTQALPTKCTRLLEAGETVARTVMPNDCAQHRERVEGDRKVTLNCNFDRNIDEVTSLVQADSPVSVQLYGSFVSKGGKSVMTLPSIVLNAQGQYEFVVCRRRADGTQYMAEGVRYIHFKHGHAVIKDSDWKLAPGQ